MKLAQLMEMFAKEIGLEKPFQQNEQGAYIFPMEADLSFTIADLNPVIGLTCSVAACPKTGLEAFYSQMLLANLFGQGTEGAVLGLSDDGNTLTLSKEIEYNIDFEQFKEVLEDFMNAIDFWRNEALTYKA